MWQNNGYLDPQNIGQFIWVGSEDEGRNMPVMQGCDAVMINRNGRELYLKSNKNFGQPSFIAYDLVRREEPEPEEPVSRQEFNQLMAMMKKMMNQNGGGENDEQ